MSRLSRLEQETIITFNAEETHAEIYTCDPVMIRRYDKLVAKSSVITVVETGINHRVYNCPKKMIKVALPRQVSEENREKLSLRAKTNLRRKESGTE